MTIKEELLSIKAASADGLLYAPEVVDWARTRPESALHSALEWNDSVAANNFRIDQVRHLIRIHVISEDGSPQLVSLTFDRKVDGGYRAISDVVKDRDLSAIMLADALAELERIKQKYSRVEALTKVWQEVRAVGRRASRRKTQPAAQAELRSA